VSVQSANWGALPHFWGTYGVGRYGLYIQEENGWGQTLRDHTLDAVQNLGLKSVRMHGLFHDDVGIYQEDETGQVKADFTKSDQIFDFFVDNGIEQIIELAPMPSALASDPSKTVFDWGLGISPPKDYAKWQELVRQFVQHSIDKYGMEVVSKWYFEVWNEPECCSGKFWAGPPGADTTARLNEYFKLYDYSAAGVRAALPNGRVGGPVSSQPLELTQNSMAGQRFLDHIKSGENYATPGAARVLDLFTYHSWSFVDGAVNGYFQGLELLDSNGFNTIPIAITEFGPTWKFGNYDEPQEMSQGAAFVAQTYGDISRRAAQESKRFPAAYAWWVISDIFDEEEAVLRPEEPFIGCMGLISREGIHKPAYNTYKFLAQMGETQMVLNVEGLGDVGGLAARDESGGVQVLIYNGQNPGKGPADDTYYEVSGPQNIAVSLSGLNPETAYDITEYRVDETHGNAYAVWEGQGRPTMAEMEQEGTQWQALRDNMDSTGTSLGSALCGDTFKKTFSLSSPGVLFLKLTPAVAQPAP